MYQRRKSPIPMLLGIIFGIVLCVCALGAMAGSSAGNAQKIAPRDAASGLATGKRQHKPISITKPVDKSRALPARLSTRQPALPKPPAYGLDREAGEVAFGDGATGARPPSGAGNVGATYRHGGGAARHEIAHTVQQRSGVMLTPLHDPRMAAPAPSDTSEMQDLDTQKSIIRNMK